MCLENEESEAGDVDRKLPCDPYLTGGPLQRLGPCQGASPLSASKMVVAECAGQSADADGGFSLLRARAATAAPIRHRKRQPVRVFVCCTRPTWTQMQHQPIKRHMLPPCNPFRSAFVAPSRCGSISILRTKQTIASTCQFSVRRPAPRIFKSTNKEVSL